MPPLYNSEFRNKGWQRKLELWNYKRKGCLGTNCRSDCAECSAWPQGCCVWGKQPLPVAIVRGLPSYAFSKVHKLKRQRVFGRKLCPAGRSLNGRLFSQWEARGLTGSHPNVSIKDRFDVHFPSKYKYKGKDKYKCSKTQCMLFWRYFFPGCVLFLARASSASGRLELVKAQLSHWWVNQISSFSYSL